MRSFIMALVTILFTTGCGGMKAYLPIIDASIIGGRGVVEATKDYTVSQDDVVGCYAASALITAFDTSKATIDSWVTSSVGDREIPAVDVDLAACHALAGAAVAPVVGESTNQKVQAILKVALPIVSSVLVAVLSSNDVTCRDLAIARGVLKYLGNAAPVVLDELANPDGKMSLPAVVLELAGCDPTSPDAAGNRAAMCEPVKL